MMISIGLINVLTFAFGFQDEGTTGLNLDLIEREYQGNINILFKLI